MFSVIIAVMMMGLNGIVAVLPKEVEVPKRVEVKKSRGKGKGSVPYFARFF